jgi:sulfate adenylyltransferase subunit 2
MNTFSRCPQNRQQANFLRRQTTTFNNMQILVGVLYFSFALACIKMMKKSQTEIMSSLDPIERGAPRVWDLELAFQHLQSQDMAQTKRAALRRLQELRFLPKALDESGLLDEHNFRPNNVLLGWAIGQARKNRRRVFFVQLHSSASQCRYLHANDARGFRFWIPLTDLTSSSIQQALIDLQNRIGRPIALFPHLALVAHLRNVPSIPRIHVCSHVYRPVLPQGLRFSRTSKFRLAPSSHLKRLESESIYILREAAAEAENPVMMYSIGKDSGVLLHLARKAFYPAPPPFPLLHIDTGWKFQEMYLFRDFVARESGLEVLVHTNPEAIEKQINPFDHGSALHTDITKTEALKQALNQYKFDVAFGGARRDEEKSRSKERIFSFRTDTHQWDPKKQRPELWNLYNTRKGPGESMRVFPLSNWTELDIWQYIYLENIPTVPLYFAKLRPVIVRNGMIMMVDDERCRLQPGEEIRLKKIRFRTLGCYPLTGAIESNSESLEDILLELMQARQSERQGRRIDTDSTSSMEKKKREGYF